MREWVRCWNQEGDCGHRTDEDSGSYSTITKNTSALRPVFRNKS